MRSSATATCSLQAFDPSTLKLSGAPIPIAEGVAFEAFRWVGNFTFSNTGRLVFQSNEAIRRSRLTWFDLDGKELGQVGEAASFFTVAISPDSRRVAATVLASRAARPEVRLYDLERGVGTRFTFGDQGANFPIWSTDGREIAFGDPGLGVRIKPADGSSEGRVVLKLVTNVWPLGWSPDGKRMLLRIQDPSGGGVDLYDFSLEGESKPRKLFATDPSEFVNGAISPDGKWLMYVSNETGRQEIYVAPYPTLGERRQVSTSGGTSARWLGRPVAPLRPALGRQVLRRGLRRERGCAADGSAAPGVRQQGPAARPLRRDERRQAAPVRGSDRRQLVRADPVRLRLRAELARK